jgi:hypothetical protein
MDSTVQIHDAIRRIRESHAVEDAFVEIRIHRLTSAHKLYLFGERYAFFGFYPIEQSNYTRGSTADVVLDFKGTRAHIFGAVYGRSDYDNALVAAAHEWFEAVWLSLSYPPTGEWALRLGGSAASVGREP